MPFISVDLWEGRPVEVKKKLVADITRVTLEDLGCPPEAVTVVLRDVPKHNWAQAGKLASESKM